MTLESAGCTHIGRRHNNEDALCHEPGLGLFAVADGVGGYEGGEVASGIVVESLRAFYEAQRRDPDGTWPFKADKLLTLEENRLRVGVRLAHAHIRARRSGALASMASTVAAVAVHPKGVVVAHCGDSRVYRLRAGRLEQLTTDHSLYAQLLATGGNPGPRAEFGFRNVVTRVLGVDDGVPEVRSLDAAPGDTLLLCSDGLHDPVDEAALAEGLALSPEVGCQRLVELAFARGGKDNITAIVVRLGG